MVKSHYILAGITFVVNCIWNQLHDSTILEIGLLIPFSTSSTLVFQIIYGMFDVSKSLKYLLDIIPFARQLMKKENECLICANYASTLYDLT
ncbi:unnamed protein product [Caenorhabditis angaria]|uniref:Uncharacterized protein n=1 Tax=Caenorhabditis angaria TaxID=860376 RepID=A0A9P1IW22_9PELO|nr:unnamed protein product [Caenorhabditis angaria]